jgi:hypothetical protein
MIQWPDYENRLVGHYLGTEIDEKWWKRYRKNKFLARGKGEYWIKQETLYFHRYLTKQPIEISFAKLADVKIGKSHAGQWLLRSPVLKLIWENDGMKLSSGFIFSRNKEETEALMAEFKRFLA